MIIDFCEYANQISRWYPVVLERCRLVFDPEKMRFPGELVQPSHETFVGSAASDRREATASSSWPWLA